MADDCECRDCKRRVFAREWVSTTSHGEGILTERFAATTEMYDKLMNVNVRGVFHSYKYAAIRLIEQGKGGRMIGAASTAGKRGDLAHV